jgi:hypothetical protein
MVGEFYIVNGDGIAAGHVPLGDSGDLKEERVKLFLQLLPRWKALHGALRMRRIHNDEAFERSDSAHREEPGDQAADVVADKQDPAMPARSCFIDQGSNIVEKVVQMIISPRGGTGRPPIDTHVRRPMPYSQAPRKALVDASKRAWSQESREASKPADFPLRPRRRRK